MKKTYIEPTIKVVKVQQMQVIAESPAGTQTKGDASSEYETLTKGNDVGNIWDDDDE